MAKTDKSKPTTQPQAKGEKKPDNTRLISDNRRARFKYEILDVLETGIELCGTEVKSLRNGQCNLGDAFGRIDDGELWLWNCHIPVYEYGNRFNHEPTRKRRLLAHKKEILKLNQRIKEKGLTLVPLRVFFRRNWVKVDIAIARGKQLYDKRQSITERETKRKLDVMAKSSRNRF